MFAPQFDIPIYTDKYSEELSDNLVKIIEKREAGFELQKIDGAGKTYQRQWSNYNIFDWKNKEIKILADQVYNSYMTFKAKNVSKPKTKVVSKTKEVKKQILAFLTQVSDLQTFPTDYMEYFS